MSHTRTSLFLIFISLSLSTEGFFFGGLGGGGGNCQCQTCPTYPTCPPVATCQPVVQCQQSAQPVYSNYQEPAPTYSSSYSSYGGTYAYPTQGWTPAIPAAAPVFQPIVQPSQNYYVPPQPTWMPSIPAPVVPVPAYSNPQLLSIPENSYTSAPQPPPVLSPVSVAEPPPRLLETFIPAPPIPSVAYKEDKPTPPPYQENPEYRSKFFEENSGSHEQPDAIASHPPASPEYDDTAPATAPPAPTPVPFQLPGYVPAVASPQEREVEDTEDITPLPFSGSPFEVSDGNMQDGDASSVNSMRETTEYSSRDTEDRKAFESYSRRHLLLKRMKNAKQLSSNTVPRTHATCNSRKLAKVMARAMEDDVTVAKKMVQRATEIAFDGTKYDVFCATGEFSYSIHSRKYCEVTKDSVTCFAFR